MKPRCKLLALFLCGVLLLSLPVYASAAEGSYKVGDYTVVRNITGVTITKYTGKDETLAVPSELDGYPVTEIGSSAFSGKDFTSVELPDTVTAIGDSAFASCKGLASVTIPYSVTSVGENPFALCTQLASISVSSNHPTLATIGGVLFNKQEKVLVSYPCCLGAETYTVPSGIKAIGPIAFCGSAHLMVVEIPDSVQAIGSGAFDSCALLESVIIPGSVQEMGVNPFSRCPCLASVVCDKNNAWFTAHDGILLGADGKLLVSRYCQSRDVAIPDSVEVIGEKAFFCDESLESLSIPETVRDIGDHAFGYCTSLKTVSFGANMKTIGSYAFIGCENLESIDIPSGIPEIPECAFAYCTTLSAVTLHEGLLKIGDMAFTVCETLQTVELPPGLDEIGWSAFSFCPSLETLSIPASVKFIADYAFEFSDNLTVQVESGSYAESYAMSFDIQHTSLVIEDTSWLN